MSIEAVSVERTRRPPVTGAAVNPDGPEDPRTSRGWTHTPPLATVA